MAADGGAPRARWGNVHVTVSPSPSTTDADAVARLVVVSPLGSTQTSAVNVRGCPARPPVSWSWYVPGCSATVRAVAAPPNPNADPAPVYVQVAPAGVGSVMRRTTSVPICCAPAVAPRASAPAMATAIGASARIGRSLPAVRGTDSRCDRLPALSGDFRYRENPEAWSFVRLEGS